MLPSQSDHLGDDTDGVYGDDGAPPRACHETYTGFRFTCWRTAHSGPARGAESGSVVWPVQLLVLYQQMGDSIPDFIQLAFQVIDLPLHVGTGVLTPLELRYLTNQIRDLEPCLSARRSIGHPHDGVEIESKLEFNVWHIELNEEYVPNTRKGR